MVIWSIVLKGCAERGSIKAGIPPLPNVSRLVILWFQWLPSLSSFQDKTKRLSYKTSSKTA